MARQMAGQYGALGKHMEDAEPVRPGKLVDRAELVRVACQYTSSSGFGSDSDRIRNGFGSDLGRIQIRFGFGLDLDQIWIWIRFGFRSEMDQIWI
jgi:hypothetical protein